MPFNFSYPEYLSNHRTRKNRVSPVSRASPAHMNSPLGTCSCRKTAFIIIAEQVNQYKKWFIKCGLFFEAAIIVTHYTISVLLQVHFKQIFKDT